MLIILYQLYVLSTLHSELAVFIGDAVASVICYVPFDLCVWLANCDVVISW